MNILVTGVNGFVGAHLTNELKNAGHGVYGAGREAEVSDDLSANLKDYIQVDLAEDFPKFKDSIDAVIHLAGLAAVGPSFDNPQQYININSAMITHMCEYFLTQEKKPRLVIVSSGAVYGSKQPMPIAESGEISFSSPYAVSKVLVENQVAYYKERGLDCVIARPFNHIGPGQAPGFILPDFYERISTTNEDVIKVGNINTKRDYTDVRDIVRAYLTLATTPVLADTIYNICSGQSLAGSEILNKLKIALERPEIAFEVDQSLVRPTDIPEIIGDSSRLQNELGWKPSINLSQTIQDFVASKRT